jgi:tartrate dehydratase alpha subunit/fumarate hydratase class I-like protein
MQRKQIVLIVMLVGSTISMSGCIVAAIGAGAGTIAYAKGDLEVVESHNLDAVYEATLKAMEELELNVTSKVKDSLSAEINARDAQDKKVKVKLSAVSDETTKVSIRVGVFGSEAKSRLIYEKINENLK